MHLRCGDAGAVCLGIKEHASDFCVDEQRAVSLDGRPLHQFLRIEKTHITTGEVAKLLARTCSVAVNDVGYAGMKDKHAQCRQWFSVPATAALSADLPDQLLREDTAAGCGKRQVQIIERGLHGRKLRRGELRGNDFRLRVTSAAPVDPGLITTLTARGFPNYFGPQRFGHGGANFERAKRWLLQRRRRRIPAPEKGRHLSVLRSFLFNEVLAARVRANSWHRLLTGDHCLNTAATGPLWGRGRSITASGAREVENRALAPHREICDALEFSGVDQLRRPLRVIPQGLRCWQRMTTSEQAPFELYLRFALPPGSFATSMLGELGEVQVL